MREWLIGLLVPVATLACAGCSVVGPASLGSGRAAYAEVVSKTNDQQLLRAVVLDRFCESMVLMAVTSITANVRLTASAGGEVGIGPSDSYSGNLVPLSLGMAYEENPTISYVPVETPAYLQQMMSPLPLGQTLLLLRGSAGKGQAMLMLIERLNGLTNPLLSGADARPSPGFLRAVEIIGDLSERGVIDMVSIGEGRYGMLVRLGEIEDRAPLEELLNLLELTDLLKPWGGISAGTAGASGTRAPRAQKEEAVDDAGSSGKGDAGGLAEAESAVVERAGRDVLVIPLRFSAATDGSSIAVMTRSLYDLVQVASASVDIPEEQVALGMAPASPINEKARSLIRIERSKSAPAHALVATKVHGNWYYIDERDLRSKGYFRLLTGIWSAQMASAKGSQQSPVLTVGVSR